MPPTFAVAREGRQCGVCCLVGDRGRAASRYLQKFAEILLRLIDARVAFAADPQSRLEYGNRRGERRARRHRRRSSGCQNGVDRIALITSYSAFQAAPRSGAPRRMPVPDVDLQKQEKQVSRDCRGRFQGGRSGNPADRSPGKDWPLTVFVAAVADQLHQVA